MLADNSFYIDGKPYKFEHPRLKVSELLELAGAPKDYVTVVADDGTKYRDLDEYVNIAPGSKFEIEVFEEPLEPTKTVVHFKVNGEHLLTDRNPISLETIFLMAGVKAAIDVNDLQSYYLENTADGRKYDDLQAQVTIVEGDNFLAIHAGSTPVA